jgi:hypothetical protein
MSSHQSASAKSSLREEFIKQLSVQDKAQRTIDTYVKAVLEFVRFNQLLSPLKATTKDIRSFLFHSSHFMIFSCQKLMLWDHFVD